MASKRALQNILGQSGGGLFSKLALNFCKWRGWASPPVLWVRLIALLLLLLYASAGGG